MTQSFLNGRVVVHEGDYIEVIRTLADNSVDAVCTDPPYHLTMKYALTGPDARVHAILRAKGKIEAGGPLFEVAAE